ncbi:MAG: hypothetical protein FWD43_02420 [Coriobacteriia bacterium]|nr:hypothetical protein [Coriobacteriia bacterium]
MGSPNNIQREGKRKLGLHLRWGEAPSSKSLAGGKAAFSPVAIAWLSKSIFLPAGPA